MTSTATPSKAGYVRKTPKVPPFARFKGTSAWRKYKLKVREYARFKARAAAHAV